MIRAYSLTISALFLFACNDSEPQLTGGPGQLTGPCIQGQCLAGLQCFVDECVPGAGSNSNSNSNSNGNSDGEPEDPTTTGGTTGVSGGVTEGGVTQPTASSNDPGTTTGDPSTTSATNVTTNVTNPTTVDRTTGVETDTWDDSASDSQNFILPETDSGGDDPCDAITCGIGETCVIVGVDPQCLAHCPLLDLGYCGADNVCVPHGDVFVCAPDASGDVGAVGDGCEYSNGCDPGHTCLNGEYVAGCNDQYCCSMFCDLGLADPCLAYGMQCVGWWEQGMAPQGFEDVGICVVV